MWQERSGDAPDSDAFPKYPLPVDTLEKPSHPNFSIRVFVPEFCLGSQLFSYPQQE